MYEVKNNAKGPHKGVRFVSSTSGAPGVARLQPHHRLRHFTKALNFLGMTTEPSTVQISGTPFDFAVTDDVAACIQSNF